MTTFIHWELSHWETGKKSQEDKVVEKEDEMGGKREGEIGGSLASTNHDREENNKDPNNQKASADDPSTGGTRAGKASLEESKHDCNDDQKSNRPMSPGTLALMCDEQDTMFMTSQNVVPQQPAPVNQNQSELYAEQERCVLTEFRDCLHKLVTFGRMKGTSKFPMCHANTELLNFSIFCFVKRVQFDPDGSSLQRRSFPWQSNLKCLPIPCRRMVFHEYLIQKK